MTATVPAELHGVWRRAWIEFADGRRDDTTFVVWLQTESAMADIRLDPSLSLLAPRHGLGACTATDLASLAEAEASSGFTTCTPFVDGRATAEWHTRGHGINFQPVTSYPEPGLLELSADGTVMIERAPSGAYVEEWHLIPGTSAPVGHEVLPDGRHVYRAGSVTVVVRDRTALIPRPARLPALIADADPAQARALVDCEFSYCEHGVVVRSTLPWMEGRTVDVDLR